MLSYCLSAFSQSESEYNSRNHLNTGYDGGDTFIPVQLFLSVNNFVSALSQSESEYNSCNHCNFRYDGGYTAASPVVVWFWKLVAGMEDSDKSALLHFCTGSSRMPAGGFGTLMG